MRWLILILATALLAVAAYVAVFGLWVGAEIQDQEAFVSSALESFDRPGSDDALGAIIAAELVEESPALEPVESVLAALFSVLITTEPFEPLRIDVARQVHEVVVGGSQDAVVADLAAYQDVVLETVAAISPGLVDLIPESAFRTYVIIDPGELPDGSAAVATVSTFGWLSLVLAVALAGLLVVITRDGRVFFVAIGVALLVAAGLIGVVVLGSSSAAEAVIPFEGSAALAENLSDVLVEPLVGRALLIGVMGAVMVLAGTVARMVGSGRSRVSSTG